MNTCHLFSGGLLPGSEPPDTLQTATRCAHKTACMYERKRAHANTHTHACTLTHTF
jgi:hypothetical protein